MVKVFDGHPNFDADGYTNKFIVAQNYTITNDVAVGNRESYSVSICDLLTLTNDDAHIVHDATTNNNTAANRDPFGNGSRENPYGDDDKNCKRDEIKNDGYDCNRFRITNNNIVLFSLCHSDTVSNHAYVCFTESVDHSVQHSTTL
eukprot:TRINITY_DN56935_c0_g1_i1.p2 TRINITY_DN56935_c0_g1~~TRINITY_DN56935_c0_g1_i1.p2  ORF type:complete len:146 (+),score=27.36 TRINITY_DN56935_c0_g1_i1:2303-2740(+)